MATGPAPILFVDPESIRSPLRFISDLGDSGAIGHDIESDLERLDGRPVVFTVVDDRVAEVLRDREGPFSLVVTPQEDLGGLDPELLGRASRVVVIGDNPTVRVPLEGPRCERLPVRYLREAPLPERATPATESDDRDDIVSLVFPTSYLGWWERFIQGGSIPVEINILTDRRLLPPAWFEDRARTHGGRVRVFFRGTAGENELFETGGRLLRDNPAVDAVDLSLLDRPRRIENVILGHDARDAVDPADVATWSKVLGWIRSGDARPFEPAQSSARTSARRGPKGPKINVVCFRPTYLFADLVKRFERKGCVHSDFPLPGADGYVWMRPQELAAFTDLVRDVKPADVPGTFITGFEAMKTDYTPADAEGVEQRSVAVHHGTCFPPIVQFDPQRLAKKLATARAVAGVCELESCYGPSFPLANPHNYELVPIGYDHTIFTEDKVRTEARRAGETLRIGFVGRAYGTDDPQQLAASPYAHPKGHRKGGDHMVAILARLRARGVPVELHVVGQRWEERIAECEGLGIPVVSHTRDEDISYRDYPAVFAGFDVLLVTARCEGGPVAAVEAMSVGVPVVGSNVGILPYLARTTDHCHVFDYDTHWHRMDHAAAEAALLTIHGRDVAHADRLAVRRSVEHLTTDQWVARLCELAVGAEVRVEPAP